MIKKTLLLFMFLSSVGFSQSNAVKTLIEKWKVRDGFEYVEISNELVKELLQNPHVFFREFSTEKESYYQWVNSLQGAVFNSFLNDPDNKYDRRLRKVYYNELKKIMLEIADENMGKWKELCVELKVKLENIEINFAEF